MLNTIIFVFKLFEINNDMNTIPYLKFLEATFTERLSNDKDPERNVPPPH